MRTRPAPPPSKKGHSHQFLARICCGQTAGWIKMPLGTEVGLVPGRIVLDGDTAPPRKGAQQLPTFRPMSIVAKRLPISATAELLCIFLNFRRASLIAACCCANDVTCRKKPRSARTDQFYNQSYDQSYSMRVRSLAHEPHKNR